MTWLLLDADMLLYQTVAACEVEIEWSQDIITTHLPIKEAQYVFNELLDTKKRQSNCERFTLCWTADQNFRKELVSTYKGNRAGNHRRKPVGTQQHDGGLNLNSIRNVGIDWKPMMY